MEEKIKKIMKEIFDIDEGQILENIEANDADWWDSIKHLSLITKLEKQFHIRFTMKEIQDMSSFEKIVTYTGQGVSKIKSVE